MRWLVPLLLVLAAVSITVLNDPVVAEDAPEAEPAPPSDAPAELAGTAGDASADEGSEDRGSEDRGAPEEPAVTTKEETPAPKPETREQLRARLTPIQWHVTQEKGTERPYTGEFWNSKEVGTYGCIVCKLPLFKSDAKFDSGCGWPSFFQPLENANLEEHEDLTHGMVRTEITCKGCGAHLGHVFNDGPAPTGLRYCINSASLLFTEKVDEKTPPEPAEEPSDTDED